VVYGGILFLPEFDNFLPDSTALKPNQHQSTATKITIAYHPIYFQLFFQTPYVLMERRFSTPSTAKTKLHDIW